MVFWNTTSLVVFQFFNLIIVLSKELLYNKGEVSSVEDKIFGLLEKLYNETTSGFKQVNNRIQGLENKIEGLENRMARLELKQEEMEDKLDEVYEGLTSHIEVNEKQHQEIMNELRGEINVVELALKRVAKQNI